MTTIATTHTRTTSSWPLFAAVSAGLATVLTAIGTFWSPLADYAATRTMSDVTAWLVVVAIIAVAVAVVFGLVVRTAGADNASRRGLVLALVGAVSVIVFWTGLPTVLAGGAACCALASPRSSVRDRVTLALAALTVIAAVGLALAG